MNESELAYKVFKHCIKTGDQELWDILLPYLYEKKDLSSSYIEGVIKYIARIATEQKDHTQNC